MKRMFASQATAVWAVAFAGPVSFVGLGLVHPIHPAIAHALDASPSDVELLFTSSFAFAGISMLFSNVVASLAGTNKTLLGGRVLIIIFSAAGASSNSVGALAGPARRMGLRQRPRHRHRPLGHRRRRAPASRLSSRSRRCATARPAAAVSPPCRSAQARDGSLRIPAGPSPTLSAL